MKKVVLLAMLLCVGLFSCKDNTPKYSIDFVKTFEGQINNKLDYVLQLHSNNGKITGEYFYKKIGKKINLSGVLTSDGNLQLTEFNENKLPSGFLQGKFINENRIEGQWLNGNKKDSLPFYSINSSSDFFIELKKSEENIKQLEFKRRASSKELQKSKILAIDYINIMSLPQVKESGRSWDTTASGNYPDVYSTVYKNGQVVFNNVNDRKENLKRNQLPLKIRVNKTFNYYERQKGVIISVTDYDTFNGDDRIGSTIFRGFKYEKGKENYSKNFKQGDFEISIDFHFYNK